MLKIKAPYMLVVPKVGIAPQNSCKTKKRNCIVLQCLTTNLCIS